MVVSVVAIMVVADLLVSSDDGVERDTGVVSCLIGVVILCDTVVSGNIEVGEVVLSNKVVGEVVGELVTAIAISDVLVSSDDGVEGFVSSLIDVVVVSDTLVSCDMEVVEIGISDVVVGKLTVKLVTAKVISDVFVSFGVWVEGIVSG